MRPLIRSFLVVHVHILVLTLLPTALWADDAASATDAGDRTIVVLVRHAEKDRSDKANRNPELTESGRARAEALVHAVGALGIDVVYSTPFHRTRQTATPIAESLGLEIQEAPVADHAAEMASMIRARHAGQTVLVVGHSDTTPALARALGAVDAPDIADDVNDWLWVLDLGATAEAEESTTLHMLRYGAPSRE